MTAGTNWTLTEHVCRHCNIGRILVRNAVHRCSVCGESVTGGIETLCGCGIGGRKRVFQCQPNPLPMPSNPAEFVIMFVGGDKPPAGSSADAPAPRCTGTANLF